VQLTRSGKNVFGVLVSPESGVKLKPGAKVLLGVFEDENLSAEVRLEIVTPTCHDDATKAFVVMLHTRSGKLVGGVSTKVPCAAEIAALTYRRSADQAVAAVAVKTSASEASQYNAKGKRTTPLSPSVKSLLTEGQDYFKEGQFEKARPLFEKAIQADGNVGEAFNGMGVTYAMRNDYDQAIVWYKKGLEAAPGFGDLYYNLACAYTQLDKNSIALRYLKLAVAKGYTDVANMDTDGDLEPLRNDVEFVAFRKQLDGPAVAPKGAGPASEAMLPKPAP
jgi:hypothetical protein